jgi:hypothetical protein
MKKTAPWQKKRPGLGAAGAAGLAALCRRDAMPELPNTRLNNK